MRRSPWAVFPVPTTFCVGRRPKPRCISPTASRLGESPATEHSRQQSCGDQHLVPGQAIYHGGSLKNIAIGCADGRIGKKMIHAAPDNVDYSKWLRGRPFQENMVESAKAVADHFGPRIVYINVLRNMSVDCDCLGVGAAPPKARDMGILASTDLFALEQASIDMLYTLPEAELHDLKERIESREGLHQLAYMKTMKMGNPRYDLIAL